jgi:hypothetical protein
MLRVRIYPAVLTPGDLIARENHHIRRRNSITRVRDPNPALLRQGLKTCSDRIPAEACPLNEEGLAHRAMVSIEAVGETEQPDVEDLLVGVKGREQIIDHLVEEAEEQ